MVYFVFRDYSYINIIRLINITMKLINKKKKNSTKNILLNNIKI